MRGVAVPEGRPAVPRHSRNGVRDPSPATPQWTPARQRATTARSRFGITANTGVSLMIASRMEIFESPPNARLPVAISYRTAPKEKISDDGSSALPSACRGRHILRGADHRAGLVSASVGVSSLVASAPVSLASPKSSGTGRHANRNQVSEAGFPRRRRLRSFLLGHM